MLEVAQGGPDADLVDAVQEDDVAGFGLLDLHAREALEHQYLVDLGLERRRVRPVHDQHFLRGAQAAASDAASLSNRSKVWLTTQSGRAPGRSTLFTTTIGFRPCASALRRTNRVCGIGPSTASISSSTPSTMDSTRSTSPPKSACPGVSTMLMCVPW